MNPKRQFTIIALLSSLFHTIPGHTHNPGLSTVELTLSHSGLQARMTFTRRDIEIVVPLDTDHSGAISTAEYAAAKPRLHDLGGRLIEIESEGRSIFPQSIEFEFDESDKLHFKMHYLASTGGDFRVTSTIIKQLSRGHRQYFVVRDHRGSVLTKSLLTARNPWTLVNPEL